MQLGLRYPPQRLAIHAGNLLTDLGGPDVLEPPQLSIGVCLLRREVRLVRRRWCEPLAPKHRADINRRKPAARLDLSRAHGAPLALGIEHALEDGSLELSLLGRRPDLLGRHLQAQQRRA